MSAKRAYFTPSPERSPQILAGLLFSGRLDRPCISFMVEDDPRETGHARALPQLLEVTICPVEEIRATESGYTIIGKRQGVAGVVAELCVDTTVEPPMATYTESEGSTLVIADK